MNTTTPDCRLATNSPDETLTMGERLGRAVEGGILVCLVGPLGAGKTQFAKGVAQGMRVEGDVTSPTFSLVNEYDGELKAFHLDAYRLPDGRALLELGFDEMITDQSIVVLEWADRVADILPADRIWIEFQATDESARQLLIWSSGTQAQRCIQRLSESFH